MHEWLHSWLFVVVHVSLKLRQLGAAKKVRKSRQHKGGKHGNHIFFISTTFRCEKFS
jgi:hypothetical protein